MPEANIKRNRNILIALTPEMLERLRAVADRTGIKSATLAALAIGDLVARMEAPDRAIRASMAVLEAEMRRMQHDPARPWRTDPDGTLAALAP